MQPPGSRPLPAPPTLHGYAFVELSVEPTSVGDTQRLLHAIGLAPAAQHRTKPVTLWHQRDIRVLLNAGAPTPPGVAAIAVESSDPARSSERADGLLAPVLARRRGPDEADLSAVAAPDGTSVFFCRTDEAGRAGRWLEDFEALAPVGSSFSGLDRVDHIALSQPFDYFDEAVLFYRSVLGLEPLESLELSAPTGLVRSRAVTNTDGSVRLALNVSLLAHGSTPPAGLQHVAFACEDVIAVAEQMRVHGLVPLAIADNYYEDLAARLELDPSLVSEMRELGVLYDRDQAGGEFLHLYTQTVGGRLFFEIVERRGGYAGYGAANAAVRLAAQRAADGPVLESVQSGANPELPS